MLSIDHTSIQKHLRTLHMEAEWQEDHQQLCIICEAAEKQYPLFLRVMEGGELFQFLAFLPFTTKESTLNDTARLLHLLNKELEVPGFGIDETHNLLFFRCLVPIKDKHIDKMFFNAYLNAVLVASQSFSGVIAAVSFGAITFEEVIRNAGSQDISQAYFDKS